MRKLKLESLNVQTFETLPAPSLARGTVRGNDDDVSAPPRICGITEGLDCTATPEACGDTAYLDCTYACSGFESCQPC